MSRLCRLKSYKTIGDDGVWAYEEITSLRGQLAASQAQIKVMREALEKISEGDIGRPHKVEKCVHTKYGFENCEECYCDFARVALNQPTDNSALRELLKAERERCADLVFDMVQEERNNYCWSVLHEAQSAIRAMDY